MLLAGGLALGCGGESGSDAPTGGTDGAPTDQKWSYATPLSLFAVCPGPLGNAEDLAATPRANENLESLALVVEPDAVVASQANYERVVADVAAIRALVPQLASIEYRPPHEEKRVQIALPDAAVEAWAMGAFGGWDCLNEAFGARVTGIMDNFDIPFPILQLRGIYNMPRVEQLYEQLPAVQAEIFEGPPEGSSWCIGRNGADYEYVVDRPMGDRRSECREHEARHFSSDAAGEATPLEVWCSADGEPLPDWYTRLCP